MSEIPCPACGKTVMDIEEVENLLRKTISKVLLSHCLCGEALEIRSLRRNVIEILTSSGRRMEQNIDDHLPSGRSASD